MDCRKSQRINLTNYRRVSELVHERRAERFRNSEALRENPEETRAAVRTYHPENRLRIVDRETQQLVEDSRDIPKTWDGETGARRPWGVRTHYLILLGANLFVVPLMLLGLSKQTPFPVVLGAGWIEGAPALLVVPMMLVVILTVGSFASRRQLGTWMLIGLCVVTIELIAWLVIVGAI